MADVRTRWQDALHIIETQLPADPEVSRDLLKWVELVRTAGVMLTCPDSTAARANLGHALDGVVDSILITMAPVA